MTNVLSNLKTALFGNRDANLSIPIMDGSLKPNNLLEEATVFAEHAGLEDLALGADGDLYAACGNRLMRVASDGSFSEVADFAGDITALAALPDGGIAVAIGTAVLVGSATSAYRMIAGSDGQALAAVNALHAGPDGALLISDGSATRPYAQWSHDLLEKGRSGRLLEYRPATDQWRTLASGLGYCFGVCVDAQNQVLVSESWRHQVSLVDDKSKARGKSRTPALAGLPGYPARMSPAAGGGFWLSLFACRTQLIEFVLCENDYRRDMMRRVDPRYWVAPALRSGHDYLEPLQGGGVKQMGILKPWAPPRSYGLVIRVGADFIPKYSLHSRVGGTNHGIVAVVQRGDDLFVLSKGAGRILRLSVSEASGGLRA